MSEEDVAHVQAICEVSKLRAVELLEASSGVVSRAVDIHLQQSAEATDRTFVENDAVELVEMPKEKAEVSPKKKQRKNVSSTKQTSKPDSKQGALHSFLGIEKPKPQPTILSFFSTSRSNGKSVTAAGAQVNDKSESAPIEQPPTGRIKGEVNAASTSPHDVVDLTPVVAKKPATKDAPSKLNVPTPQKSNDSPKVPKKEESQMKPVDPRLSYGALASSLFSVITQTSKRNAKLNMLKATIKDVIDALGGIQGDTTSRKSDAQVLTAALELISGKISLEASDLVTPAPLQVSGAAVSSAVQLVCGGVSKSRLREAYRKTGDLGDVAAEFFSPGQSVKNFFVPRKKATDETVSKDEATSKSASIVQIHGMLQSVASVPKGTGSQKQRHNILVKLLRLATTKDELKFLARILLGNMRLGATMKSLLAGLAMAVQAVQTQETSTQHAIQTVQATFDICPRLNKIVLALLCGGVERMVEECNLEVLIPIQPSLANPAHSLEEVEKFMTKGAGSESSSSSSNSVVAEWKYDGVRCQAHFDGKEMKLFSRNLIDNTSSYPDASKFMLDSRKDNSVKSFIIDSEIVGVAKDGKTDEWRLLPFQILSTRRGTKNADSDTAVQIRVFAFDLMYLNGVSLIKKSLWERQRLLRESFRETNGFTFARCQEFAVFDKEKITAYLQDAVKGGAEGLMMKLRGRPEVSDHQSGEKGTEVVLRPMLCPYESGTRSTTWLKLKRDYVSGFADTLDVVPIGAWYGSGRKAEKGFLSPILFAVYDEDDGVFRSISRCMSFTDSMYQACKEFYFHGTPYPAGIGLSGGETAKKEPSAADDAKSDDISSDAYEEGQSEGGVGEGEAEEGSDDEGDDDVSNFVGVNCFPGRPSTSVYVTNESPTIWFQPKEVWEVSFADLTLSRTHTAAAGLVEDPECRGVALRFPRFKRRRPDKGVEQATTSIQIAQLFTKQFKQR